MEKDLCKKLRVLLPGGGWSAAYKTNSRSRAALLPRQAGGWLAGESWLRFGKQLNYRQQIPLGKQVLLSKLSKNTSSAAGAWKLVKPRRLSAIGLRLTKAKIYTVSERSSHGGLKLADLKACKPESLQTLKLVDVKACRPESLQTLKLVDLQAAPPGRCLCRQRSSW